MTASDVLWSLNLSSKTSELKWPSWKASDQIIKKCHLTFRKNFWFFEIRIWSQNVRIDNSFGQWCHKIWHRNRGGVLKRENFGKARSFFLRQPEFNPSPNGAPCHLFPEGVGSKASPLSNKTKLRGQNCQRSQKVILLSLEMESDSIPEKLEIFWKCHQTLALG